jgi:hypothetical protein
MRIAENTGTPRLAQNRGLRSPTAPNQPLTRSGVSLPRSETLAAVQGKRTTTPLQFRVSLDEAALPGEIRRRR